MSLTGALPENKDNLTVRSQLIWKKEEYNKKVESSTERTPYDSAKIVPKPFWNQVRHPGRTTFSRPQA